MLELIFTTGDSDISIGYTIPSGTKQGTSNLPSTFKANTKYNLKIYGYGKKEIRGGLLDRSYHYYHEYEDSVPASRTINGKSLNENIVLSYDDLSNKPDAL
jgi:hypothetical protein